MFHLSDIASWILLPSLRVSSLTAGRELRNFLGLWILITTSTSLDTPRYHLKLLILILAKVKDISRWWKLESKTKQNTPIIVIRCSSRQDCWVYLRRWETNVSPKSSLAFKPDHVVFCLALSIRRWWSAGIFCSGWFWSLKMIYLWFVYLAKAFYFILKIF